MRDNPNMTTWLLLGGGAFAAYYFYLKPRMDAQAAAQAAAGAAPAKRDWVSEALNVIISGTQARQRQQKAKAADAKIKSILEGKSKSAPPTWPPINWREWL